MDNELEDYLRKIVEMTYEGKIRWNQTNPSTFSWENTNGDDRFIVTIQKAFPPRTNKPLNTIQIFLMNWMNHIYFKLNTKDR